MQATTTIAVDSRDSRGRSWRVTLAGRFCVADCDGRDVTPKSRKARAIVAHLAARAGQRIARDHLINLFWGDRFEAQARLSLRQALFEIRKCGGERLINSDREHLWIDPALVEVVGDVGEPLPGLSGISVEFDDWLAIERQRRANGQCAQLKSRAEQLLEAGDAPAALLVAEEMREIDPLNDAWLRLALEAEFRAGNLCAVQKRFNDFSELLQRELGVAPAAETVALKERLVAELTKKPSQGANDQAAAADRPAGELQLPRELTALATGRAVWRDRLAIAAVLSILALLLVAFWEYSSARQERSRAQDMSEFMLGDLKDQIQSTGKLNAIAGVASRVAAYYQGKRNSDLSDPELRQRSRALGLLGEVQNQLGNTDAAARLFTRAADGTSEAIRRKPDDPQRLFDHAQNVFWLGELARKRGDMDKAEARYREYKRLADRMTALDPDSLKWRMEVMYANENIGIALYGKRQFGEAARRFQSALAPMESVASINGPKSEYQVAIANAMGWLADALRAKGDLVSATAVRQRQANYITKALTRDRDDVVLRQRLVPAREGLGVLFNERGMLEAATEQFRLALAEADRLVTIEPGNADSIDLATNVRFELAANLLALGRRGEAASEVASGCRAAAALLNRDSKVLRWLDLKTACLSMRARIAFASGAYAQALAMADQALAEARAQRGGDQIRARYRIAAAARLAGDIRNRAGDTAGARAVWSAALGQLPAHVTERPREMNERTQLLRRLGRTEESRQLALRLASMQFNDSR